MKIKKNKECIKYIKHLAQYLRTFFVKIYRSVNFNETQDITHSKFEDDFEHLENNKNKSIELK